MRAEALFLIHSTLELLKEHPEIYTEDPRLKAYFSAAPNRKIPSPPPIKKISPPPPPPLPQMEPEKPKPKPPAPAKKLPGSISLQQQETPQTDSCEEMRPLFEKIAPQLFLHKVPPSDQKAKSVRFAWKVQKDIPCIPILVTKQLEPMLPFLKEVAKAIRISFDSSDLVEVAPLEQENSWPSFLENSAIKLIIIPDMILWTCPHLLTHYSEKLGAEKKKERFLKNIPVLLLPDPFLYKKDPLLKRSLWNVLCQSLLPS